jgi:radical SAM protein with 4Fe4S-binding SPASM domain
MEAIPLIQAAALELTNECQNTCIMCWAQCPHTHPQRPKGYMKYELFTRLVDELIAQSPNLKLQIALSYGGESMLHPEYDRCLRYLQAHTKIKPMIFTNAILLDKYKRLLKEEDVNTSIHRQGFIESIRAIEYYVKYSKRYVTAHIVEGEFSQMELIMINRVLSKIANVNTHPLITEDLKSIYKRPEPCTEPFKYIAILWNGETLPCCHILASGTFTMGNVSEKSIFEIWEGDAYNRLRTGDHKRTPCETCELYSKRPGPLQR